MTYPNGETQPGISFFEMNPGDLIVKIADFWPERYQVPSSRAHLVERY